MKCTTKILIGILLSGVLLVIAGGIVIFSWALKPHEKPQESGLGGKPMSVDVAFFRVVNISMHASDGRGSDRIAIYGDINLLPTTNKAKQFIYPEELAPYLKVVEKNDTLNIQFNISEHKLPNHFKHGQWISINCTAMTLTAGPSLAAVRSDVSGLNVRLLGMEADSITLNADRLSVDSCHFNAVAVQSSQQMNLSNSTIKNVYLDLDRMGQWSVNNCRIANEYLTGSGHHHNNLQKGECAQMHWTPKHPDAELNVRLKGKASVSLAD